MWKIVLAVPTLWALVSCAGLSDPEPAGLPDVTVELDAFSGRPNPRWTLAPAQAAELARRLRDLPRSDATGLPQGVLGYRGFLVLNRGGEGGIPESAYISREGLVLVVTGRGPAAIFRDSHGAQEWLVSEARRRGYDDVFRRASAARPIPRLQSPEGP